MKSRDFKEWLVLSLLLLLPSGVFCLALIDPSIRPAAVQFAQVAFGSVIAKAASGRSSSNQKSLPPKK
jgi:hypothetical protein